MKFEHFMFSNYLDCVQKPFKKFELSTTSNFIHLNFLLSVNVCGRVNKLFKEHDPLKAIKSNSFHLIRTVDCMWSEDKRGAGHRQMFDPLNLGGPFFIGENT